MQAVVSLVPLAPSTTRTRQALAAFSFRRVFRNPSRCPPYIPYRQGVSILAACLPSSIAEVDLSNNPAIREKGGEAIGRFLVDYVRSANLRRLDVSMCNLGDEGLRMLAEGVETAKGLEWLGIAGNLNGTGGVGAGGGTGVGKTAIGEWRPRSDLFEGRCYSIAWFGTLRRRCIVCFLCWLSGFGS